jgi:hypothetical protein
MRGRKRHRKKARKKWLDRARKQYAITKINPDYWTTVVVRFDRIELPT